MAWRERKVAENGPDGEPAKSAGFRKNPRKHAGTVAIRRKKAPTENSWGFNSGGAGGNEERPSTLTKVVENQALNYAFQLHHIPKKVQVDGSNG